MVVKVTVDVVLDESSHFSICESNFQNPSKLIILKLNKLTSTKDLSLNDYDVYKISR